MAQRNRSKDAESDSEKVLGAGGTVSQAGRSGGTLQRDIATQDELKRTTEHPAGKTRVTKSDEKDKGNA